MIRTKNKLIFYNETLKQIFLLLSVEYPGYGIYSVEPNAKRILDDAEIVYDFLTNEIQIPSDNIILFGRSMGSGPATYLAGNRNPGLLILMSPYISIKEAVKDIVGKWATYLIAERFRNIDEIAKTKCPCFFIHGENDRLIPSSHSIELYGKCKSLAGIHISNTMTHNEYSLIGDIVKPLRKFLKEIRFSGTADTKCRIIFPDYVKKIPFREYKNIETIISSKIELFKNDENNVDQAI